MGTPAVRARPRRTRGEMISIPPVPIITGMVVQLLELILNKPVMLVSMRPTLGAFLTCTEMFGSGCDWKANYSVVSDQP